MTTLEASLSVHRPVGVRDKATAYKVMVDGNLVATINEGEVRRVTLPSGPHRVEVRYAWVSSRSIEVTCGAGKTVSVTCKSGGTPLSGIIQLIFNRRDYIDLIEGQRTDEPILSTSGSILAGAGLIALLSFVVIVVSLILCLSIGLSAGVTGGVTVTAMFLALLIVLLLHSHRERSKRWKRR